MPDLVNALAVGVAQAAGDRYVRKRSNMVALQHGGVALASTAAVSMVVSAMPNVQSAVVNLSEDYGEMLASAVITTAANRMIDNKSIMAKGVFRDFLWSLGYQAVGMYAEDPIRPYLPAIIAQN